MNRAAYETFVVALAAPIVRARGGDERRFGGGISGERANELAETLFLVKRPRDAISLLNLFARHGQRSEWAQYAAHAGGAWTPDPHDASVVRKASYAVEHKTKLGDRGLLAFDAMRSAAIAGWCAAAGLLSDGDAFACVGLGLVRDVATKHGSWDEVAEQIRLAYGFTDGGAPAEIAQALDVLLAEGGLWRTTAWPKPEALEAPEPPKLALSIDEEKDDDEGPDPARPRTIVAITFSVDCEGCGLPVSFGSFAARSTCSRCGTVATFSPAEWEPLLRANLRSLRSRAPDHDPFWNDFGRQWFSRRWVQRVECVRCTCDAPLPTPERAGPLACERCGRTSIVHEPDATARSISRRARLVVEPPRAPVSPPTSFGCAQCDARLTDVSARVVRCASCNTKTFVDDATWRAVHGPAIRPKTYVLFAW